MSRVVPYSKAQGPPEFSAMLPPMVEAVLEAGSSVSRKPSRLAASTAAWVMTPTSRRMVRLAASTGKMREKRVIRTTTERRRAGTAPPVMPDAPPRGTRANFISLASFTSPVTCSGVDGSTTSRGSSMRRSVASVAQATRALARATMASAGNRSESRSTSSARNAACASCALQNRVMPSLMLFA